MCLVCCEQRPDFRGTQGVLDRVRDELPGSSRYRRTRNLAAVLVRYGLITPEPGSRPPFPIPDRKCAAEVSTGLPADSDGDEVRL